MNTRDEQHATKNRAPRAHDTRDESTRSADEGCDCANRAENGADDAVDATDGANKGHCGEAKAAADWGTAHACQSVVPVGTAVQGALSSRSLASTDTCSRSST